LRKRQEDESKNMDFGDFLGGYGVRHRTEQGV
jgi:hypothetical protein